MKRTLIATVVILGLASATMARPGFGKGMRDGQGMGQRGCTMQGRGGPGAGGGLMAMADELQLTEQQADQIQKLQTEFRLQMVDQQAAVKKANIALRALMRDDAPESKVTAAIDDLSAKKAQLQKQRYRHHQQIRSILTEEQQQKAKKLRMDRDCDGDGPRGGRHGMHGGRFFDDDSDEVNG
ncbi:MAG: Spy/CpxP family protein refolding chaperone [bacterium]